MITFLQINCRVCWWKNLDKKLSYCKEIARQLRTQYVGDIYRKFVTLKSRLGVIEGHWKWRNWIDRIRVLISVL